MRTRMLIWVALVLSGCSFSDTITSDTLTYDEVIEDTTDKMLLLNVLRARDNAPLHFADIPLIHESLQASATAGLSEPFGASNRGTARNTVTAGIGLQSAPTFDVSHLDAKDFATGIASAIDPKFVKYWLDRGLDRRVVLLLFFSGAEITAKGKSGDVSIKIANDPRTAIAKILSVGHDMAVPCADKTQFELYLSLIDELRSFFATAYSERRLVASGIELNQSTALKDLLSLDTTKLSLVRTKDKPPTYDIYAVAPGQSIALCYNHAAGVSALSLANGPAAETDACTHATIWQKEPETATTKPTPTALEPGDAYCALFDQFETYVDPAKTMIPAQSSPIYGGFELRLSIRSVGEMIQYLGDILAYQDALARPNPSRSLNNPVTLGFCPKRDSVADPKACPEGDGGVFFNVRDDLRLVPGDIRFSLDYRGQSYDVRRFTPASGLPATPANLDHTLEVLAVLNQMIDLNKSATDFKSTPYVQVIP